MDRIGLATQTREGGSRIRKRIHADAEPGHAVASRNSHDAEQQNDDNARCLVLQQHSEVQHDDHGDERFEQQQKFALRDEIRLASLVDQLGNFTHRAVHRQVFQPRVDGQSEKQAEDAEDDANREQLVAVNAEELNLRKIRQLQIGFAAGLRSRLCQRCRRAQQRASQSCPAPSQNLP